ncbi:hypothetical protein [Streptomyces sp. NPDC001919]
MTAHNELRLLPWSGPDGKPCYLSTDDDNSHLSRLADTTEAIQVGLADNLLARALVVLSDQNATPDELRVLSTNLVGALRDILRIAEIRSRDLSARAVH